MKSFSKFLALLTVVALLLGTAVAPVSASEKVTVSIDGKGISMSSTYGIPYIDAANRTMVPLRIISEKLNREIKWDSATKTVTIDGTVEIRIGSDIVKTPYGNIAMDTSAVIKGERTYVPFRYVGEALGYDVEWKSSTKTANVITKSELTISAAASLKNALEEIKGMYLNEKPNAKVAITYGGSGTLQQQIEQGAPVDVFLSAATSNMNNLKGKGLLDNGTIKNILKNKVVLIAPTASKLTIKDFSAAAAGGVKKIALGEPVTVPAGKYAQQVFAYYKNLDAVKAKAVYAKDVTEVLTWVASGNVDLGVVYSTDAKSSTKVKILATAPEASHDPVVYPGAVVKSTDQPVAAKDFLHYLTSDKAEGVFEKYGFSVI
jgi:molybdate transport system substrate-binding protein